MSCCDNFKDWIRSIDQFCTPLEFNFEEGEEPALENKEDPDLVLPDDEEPVEEL